MHPCLVILYRFILTPDIKAKVYILCEYIIPLNFEKAKKKKETI